jgi:4-amino-4-deoxy-L-arabinose transferase-like glycosyltransferase
VGSSGNNCVFNLIVGYNGVERLTGMNGGNNLFGGGTMGAGPGGGNIGGQPGAQSPNNQGMAQMPPGRPDGGDGNREFQAGGPRQQDGQRMDGGQRPGNFGGQDGRSSSGTLSKVFRLFLTPLSKEVSWLLPFSLFGIGLLVFGSRLRWPLTRKHRAAVLWGGWLLTCLVFFTIAGFYHEYYLSIMGPPLAALVGIGAVRLWRLSKRRPWWALGLLVAASALTLALQVNTINTYVKNAWWLPIMAGLALLGVLVYALSAFLRRWRSGLALGMACIMAALLVTPLIWSGYTVAYASSNQSLPASYSGQSSGLGSARNAQVNQALLSFLQANTQGMKYLMAVPSSMQGSDYILATGRPVLLMGGFMGQDKVLTAEKLAALVKNGELRYIYNSGGGGFNGGQTDVSEWIASNCKIVEGFDTTTHNTGAPDGTNAGNGANAANGSRTMNFGGDMQVSLYDCAQ